MVAAGCGGGGDERLSKSDYETQVGTIDAGLFEALQAVGAATTVKGDRRRARAVPGRVRAPGGRAGGDRAAEGHRGRARGARRAACASSPSSSTRSSPASRTGNRLAIAGVQSMPAMTKMIRATAGINHKGYDLGGPTARPRWRSARRRAPVGGRSSAGRAPDVVRPATSCEYASGSPPSRRSTVSRKAYGFSRLSARHSISARYAGQVLELELLVAARRAAARRRGRARRSPSSRPGRPPPRRARPGARPARGARRTTPSCRSRRAAPRAGSPAGRPPTGSSARSSGTTSTPAGASCGRASRT